MQDRGRISSPICRLRTLSTNHWKSTSTTPVLAKFRLMCVGHEKLIRRSKDDRQSSGHDLQACVPTGLCRLCKRSHRLSATEFKAWRVNAAGCLPLRDAVIPSHPPALVGEDLDGRIRNLGRIQDHVIDRFRLKDLTGIGTVNSMCRWHG